MYSKDILKHYVNKPTFYIGDLGKIQNFKKHIVVSNANEYDIMNFTNDNVLKFGISNNVLRRYKEHHNKFPQFDLQIIKEFQRNRDLENYVIKELKLKNMLLKMQWDGRLQRELFYLSKANINYEWFQNFIDDIVYKETQTHLY